MLVFVSVPQLRCIITPRLMLSLFDDANHPIYSVLFHLTSLTLSSFPSVDVLLSCPSLQKLVIMRRIIPAPSSKTPAAIDELEVVLPAGDEDISGRGARCPIDIGAFQHEVELQNHRCGRGRVAGDGGSVRGARIRAI